MRQRDYAAIVQTIEEHIVFLQRVVMKQQAELREVRDRERDIILRLFTDLDDRQLERPSDPMAGDGMMPQDQVVREQQGPTGPVPATPTAWGAREEVDASEFEDPTDLSQPLDQLPPEYEVWGLAEEVPLGEPVPEGQREKIVGIAPGENPFEELGIKPAWAEE